MSIGLYALVVFKPVQFYLLSIVNAYILLRHSVNHVKNTKTKNIYLQTQNWY